MKTLTLGMIWTLVMGMAWGAEPTVTYEVSGDYFEGCSCRAGACACDFGQDATGMKGCQASMFFHIEKGHYGDVSLDGVNVAALLLKPVQNVGASVGKMEGGIYVDDKADAQQQTALTALMKEKFGSLFSSIRGPRPVTIHFEKLDVDKEGLADKYHLDIPNMLTLEVVPFKNEAGKRSARINVPGTFVTIQYMAKASTHVYDDKEWKVNWDLSGGNGFYSPFHFVSEKKD